MRIIYLHQYFNTPDMPGATRSYELGRRLVRNGHEVHMITADRTRGKNRNARWRQSNEAGIIVHWADVPYSNKMSFFGRVKSFLTFAFVASRKAASLRGDVVLATSTPLTIAIPGAYASRIGRIPMIFEVRDLWPEVPIALGVLRHPLLKWSARRLERFAYCSSSHVVALAPGMKDEIRKTGFPSDRISVIPNGCDIELFADNAPRRLELRAQHDWLGDRPLISYVGAIGKINAVDYLVEISGETFALDPEIRFAVIGTGIEEENVRKLAQDRGIYGKTFFMLGAVPKRRAAVWVSASTMTIALVRGPRFIWKDATQNKYFDSLAAGRPVASNYDGWQAQVASDVGAGIILDRDDHRAAARQLLSAVRDTEWLEGAARAAADLANQRYSRDKQAEELERILAETVADHQRRKVPS